MTPTRTRRLSTVIAGCIAMAASLTALGAIVVSDIAEAKATQDVVVLDDAIPVAPPVKLTKIAAKPEPELDDLDELLIRQMELSKPMPGKPGQPGKGRKPRVDFGSFEGY